MEPFCLITCFGTSTVMWPNPRAADRQLQVPELLVFTPSQGSCHASYAINRLILTSLLAVDHSSDSHTVRFKEQQRVLGNLLLWLGAMETFSRPIRGLYSCIGCLLASYFLNEINCGLRLVCGGGYWCRSDSALSNLFDRHSSAV